jgi:hypothetical protein
VATSATGSVGALNGREARAHACAFGKHPAWDDHIEDIGLEHDRLVWIKRVLYAEGIAGNIDSGAWEKIEEPKRLPAFNHRFYWRTPEGLIVGRFWSSRDGKGRTKYPMVACAWVEGVPDAWAVEQISSRLERFEQTVKQTDNAELVKLAVGQLQRELSTAAAVVLGAPGGENTALVAKLIDSPALDASGQKGLGLLRVVYEIERELATFKSSATSGFLRKGDASAPRAQHLRVPTGLTQADGPGAGPRAWLAVMDQELGRNVPVLVLEPIGESFLDIIVGEPGPSMLFCTRASAQGLALTTEVPYSLDQTFVERANGKIQAWKDAALINTKTPTKTPSKSPARPEPSATPKSTPATGGTGKSKLPLILGAAAIGAAAMIGIAIVATGGKSKTPPEPAPSPENPKSPDATPNAGSGTTPSATQPSTSQTAKPPTSSSTPPTPPPVTETPPQNPSSATTPATTPAASTPVTPPPSATKPAVTPPSPAVTGDPRASWTASERASTLRERLALMANEQAAQGVASESDIASRLERLERQIGILSARELSPSGRDALARDLGVVDNELSTLESQVAGEIASLRSRVRESLGNRAKVSPVESEALARAWASGLSQIDPAIGWAQAEQKADALANSLKALERDMANPRIDAPQGSSIDGEAIRATAHRKRDAALDAAAGAILANDQSRVAVVRDELNAWTGLAQQYVTDAAALEQAIKQGMPSNEPASVPGANGRSPTQIAEQLRSSSVARELGPAIAPIMARLADVGSVEQSNDAAALAAILTDGSRTPAEVAAAVRRLAMIGPAAGEEGLVQYIDAMTSGVNGAVARLSDAGDRDALQRLAAESAKEAWNGAVPKLATTEAGLRSLVSLGQRVGATDADVAQWPAFARVNLARMALADAAKMEGPGAAKLAAIRAKIAEFNAVAAGAPEVDTSALRAALAPITESRNDLDFAAIGPASAGWTLVNGAEDGSRATYSWKGPNGDHTLEFHRVMVSTNGEESPAYLAKTEASVGLVLDLMGEKLGWPKVREQKAMRVFRPGDTDPRRGVRTWDWSANATEAGSDARGIVSAPRGRANTSLGWMGFRAGMEGVAWYPEGAVQAGPDANSPMDQISLVSATIAAQLAGCRLPTLNEWRAASGASDTLPEGAAATSNLRDASWKRVFDHLAQHTSKQPHFPSSGIFQSAETEKISETDDNVPAVTSDDGVVWFAQVGTPVGGPATVPFIHLIGNVAEFVSMSDTQVAATTPAELKKAMQAGDYRVVGASALSPANLPMVAQIPGRNWAEQTYADVGFRLAFGAPKSAVSAASATRQLEEALDQHGYVAP